MDDYKKHTTKDGSLSLYSLSYEEGFHDKDGALRESINKYLLPAQLEEFYNAIKMKKKIKNGSSQDAYELMKIIDSVYERQ